jgi:RNA polymerase sigma-70 factor (ECF subfamily)
MFRRMAAVDLADPQTFSRIYDEHARTVYGAALRILGNPAQAQDVTQDVFLRLWRRPRRFDPQRGELGSYLRLMARSRALDLYREGQAAGRASDRMRLVVARDEGRVDDPPAPSHI